MLWILLSFVLSTDIYINALTTNTNCLDQTGCSINALTEYSEDTNGDVLHILGDICNPNDTFQLMTWLSTKSFSELTIIGSPSAVYFSFSRHNRMNSLKLNESIITFDKINFVGHNSQFLSITQTYLTITNSIFSDVRIVEHEFMRIEDSSCSFNNVTFINLIIYPSICLFINSKVHFDDISLSKDNVKTSNAIFFAFRKKCEVFIQSFHLRNSKLKHPVIQIEDSIADISSIFIGCSDSVLFNAVLSKISIHRCKISCCNFSFGKFQCSSLNLSDFHAHNILSSQALFDFKSTQMTFYNIHINRSQIRSIVRSEKSENSKICNFRITNVSGLGTFFVFSNSKILMEKLNIENVTVPQYGGIINNRNTNTTIVDSLFSSIETPQSLGFLFTVKDNYFTIIDSNIVNNSIAILNVVSGNWVINTVSVSHCKLELTEDQSSKALIVGTTFDFGRISNSHFHNCDVSQGIIHCIQAKMTDIVTSKFINCRGTKTGVISMIFSDISISQCIFKGNSALFLNSLITLQNCSSIISTCVFSQNAKSDGPTLKIYNPTKFSLSQVQASEYNIFGVFYDVSNPISIIDCVFAKSFPDTFYFNDSQHEIGLLHQVFFDSTPMNLPLFDNDSTLSNINFFTYQVKETKLSKNINYVTIHENFVYSPTRYYEYMMNLNPLSRQSPPFRTMPDLLNESITDFRSEIERSLLEYHQFDQILYYLSQFTAVFFAIKCIALPFLIMFCGDCKVKLKQRKTQTKEIKIDNKKPNHSAKKLIQKKKRR